MKIAVTGGNGFLGSSIVKKLISENNEVYVFSSSTNNLNLVLHQIKFSYGYTNDIPHFNGELAEFSPDVVIHCGWSGGNNYNDINDLNQFYDNIEPGINLIRMISKLPKKPMFIGLGSFSEYGNFTELVNESSKENPINLYGLSKFTFKNYSKLLCEQNNMKWAWVRPCYIYGPNDVDTRLIPLLIRKFLNGEEVILDECNKTIDYLYIDDFVNYFYSLLLSDEEGVFNICSGIQYNLKNIINEIHKLTNSESRIVFDSELNRKLTSPFICGDNSKILKLTGIQPKTDLTSGLIKTINYFKKINETIYYS
jgi:nucleoside-diphosphate-sugar epimerase